MSHEPRFDDGDDIDPTKTPKTYELSVYGDEAWVELLYVRAKLSEWLERSRRDNIRKRWEMRRVMRNTYCSCYSNAYDFYLKELRK